MRDSYGREISYLRLSVTDLCTLRCRYCMPQSGIRKLPHSALCSLEELRDFAAAAAKLGVRKIRLTGGEPLARHGILTLIGLLRAIPQIEELCLTTNGTRLCEYAENLRAAGADRLNISLDTLRPDRYREITRTGALRDVLQGIDAAERAGFESLKINCVLIKGFNEDEIEAFARLTSDKPWQVRFIELMPVGACAAWARAHYLSAQTVLEKLPGLLPVGQSGVAQLYRLPDAAGSIGLIAPRSRAFCADCSKIRITADGNLKPCLHSDTEIPLRGLKEEALLEAIRQGIMQKPPRHNLEENAIRRDMVSIGG